ncbi:MAG: hypothetical protein M1814_003211 [Vezdaea aestivalis]|nr:MAG: hypothetical protein M1814_003211 [Vezdaea aestivalis]
MVSSNEQPILSDRPVNAPLTGSNTGNEKATGRGQKAMDYHRHVLKSNLGEEGSQQNYVSPSDNIVSPCTAKLSGLKNKHFMKAKGQTLFGKSGLSSDSGFQDAEPAKEQGNKTGES